MEQIKSAFLRLDSKDIVKGILIAFLAPILAMLSTTIGAPGFTFSSLDFAMLFKIGLAAGLSYLVKNFFSTKDGRFLGTIG